MDLQRTAQKAITCFHTQVFRLTNGMIGGRLGKLENVLLTTTGRKSGLRRTTPLTVTVDGDRLILVASNGGSRTHPDWYLNLSANPDVEVQRGAQTQRMRARTASGDEQADLWAKVVATYPGYDNYQRRTDRQIPLVICEAD